MFNPLDYPLALSDPQRLSEGAAWAGHIPFAWALLEMARPEVLVELGTYQGDSYCAFCQGVAELKLPAKCFAVDTWQGDAQMGAYPEQILADLRAHHDPRYGGFSMLLRATFDEAAPHFEDGSVDLLHIDGLHTYDAVKHDYDTWLPKMSERGVILFHDTAQLREDFGVHQLWKEISPRFPHAHFEHDNGLGVLGVGKGIPAPVMAFLTLQGRERDLARRYFEVLGGRISLARLLNHARNAARRAMDTTAQWRAEKNRRPYPTLDDADFVSAFSLLSRDVAEIIAESRGLRERASHGGSSEGSEGGSSGGATTSGKS
jgi:Methyltransferase domain